MKKNNMKYFNKLFKHIYFKLIIFIILKPLLSWVIFLILFLFLRAYFFHIVSAAEKGTLWQQMNDPDYEPSKHQVIVLENGTEIELYSDGYGMDYMKIGDEITPLGMTITVNGGNSKPSSWESSDFFTSTEFKESVNERIKTIEYPLEKYTKDKEFRKLVISDIMGMGIIEMFKSQTYFGQYAGNDILEHIQQRNIESITKEDVDTATTSNINNFNYNIFYKEFKELVYLNDIDINSSDFIKIALAYVEIALPVSALSKSNDELNINTSAINIFTSTLHNVKTTNLRDLNILIHLESAAYTYNVARLLNCLNDSSLLEKVHLATFFKIKEEYCNG